MSKPTSEKQAEIGDRLKAHLKRLGVSISDLGRAWGKHRQTAQQWVHGRSLPPGGEIPALCEMLGLDANTFLGVDARAELSDSEIGRIRSAILDRAKSRRTPRGSKGGGPKRPRKRPLRLVVN